MNIDNLPIRNPEQLSKDYKNIVGSKEVVGEETIERRKVLVKDIAYCLKRISSDEWTDKEDWPLHVYRILSESDNIYNLPPFPENFEEIDVTNWWLKNEIVLRNQVNLHLAILDFVDAFHIDENEQVSIDHKKMNLAIVQLSKTIKVMSNVDSEMERKLEEMIKADADSRTQGWNELIDSQVDFPNTILGYGKFYLPFFGGNIRIFFDFASNKEKHLGISYNTRLVYKTASESFTRFAEKLKY